MSSNNAIADQVFPDTLVEQTLESEIQRRALCYLRDSTYLDYFGLLLTTSGSDQLITFDGAMFALKIHPSAPMLLYKQLTIECNFVESAAHLAANLLARMAKETLSSMQESLVCPSTFCCVNGYQMMVGLDPEDIFDIYQFTASCRWKYWQKMKTA